MKSVFANSNNAGIIERKPFLEIKKEEWDSVLSVNLTGAFLFSQAVAKVMVRQGREDRQYRIHSWKARLVILCALRGGVVMD